LKGGWREGRREGWREGWKGRLGGRLQGRLERSERGRLGVGKVVETIAGKAGGKAERKFIFLI
jgi:hypothetical protein